MTVLRLFSLLPLLLLLPHPEPILLLCSVSYSAAAAAAITTPVGQLTTKLFDYVDGSLSQQRELSLLKDFIASQLLPREEEEAAAKMTALLRTTGPTTLMKLACWEEKEGAEQPPPSSAAAAAPSSASRSSHPSKSSFVKQNNPQPVSFPPPSSPPHRLEPVGFVLIEEMFAAEEPQRGATPTSKITAQQKSSPAKKVRAVDEQQQQQQQQPQQQKLGRRRRIGYRMHSLLVKKSRGNIDQVLAVIRSIVQAAKDEIERRAILTKLPDEGTEDLVVLLDDIPPMRYFFPLGFHLVRSTLPGSKDARDGLHIAVKGEHHWRHLAHVHGELHKIELREAFGERIEEEKEDETENEREKGWLIQPASAESELNAVETAPHVLVHSAGIPLPLRAAYFGACAHSNSPSSTPTSTPRESLEMSRPSSPSKPIPWPTRFPTLRYYYIRRLGVDDYAEVRELYEVVMEHKMDDDILPRGYSLGLCYQGSRHIVAQIHGNAPLQASSLGTAPSITGPHNVAYLEGNFFIEGFGTDSTHSGCGLGSILLTARVELFGKQNQQQQRSISKGSKSVAPRGGTALGCWFQNPAAKLYLAAGYRLFGVVDQEWGSYDVHMDAMRGRLAIREFAEGAERVAREEQLCRFVYKLDTNVPETVKERSLFWIRPGFEVPTLEPEKNTCCRLGEELRQLLPRVCGGVRSQTPTNVTSHGPPTGNMQAFPPAKEQPLAFFPPRSKHSREKDRGPTAPRQSAAAAQVLPVRGGKEKVSERKTGSASSIVSGKRG